MTSIYDLLDQQELDYLKKNGVTHVRWKQSGGNEIEVWFEEMRKRK